VYFNSQAVIDPSTGLSRACVGLTSSNGSFNSVNELSGYTGTVSLGQALTVGNFELDSGALAQQDAVTGQADDLTVVGVFTWTGGTLNSTPNTPTTANVNIDGGGSITLPGVGSTLTTGSTLNFGNSHVSQVSVVSSGTPSVPTAIATTVISGAGTLLLAGQNPNALNVMTDAEVVNKVALVAPTDIEPANNAGGGRTLTLADKAAWGYIGTGGASATLGFQVVNNGGKFFVGTTDNINGVANAGLSSITVQIKSGATTTGYTQQKSADATLEINSSSTLDVSNTLGASVSAGQVTLSSNANAGQEQQISTLKGKLSFSGGSIGFGLSPILIGKTYVFVTFAVTVDVQWSGGTYTPGFDARAVGGTTSANHWSIGGALTIDLTQAVKPKVVPLPQLKPANQLTWKGTWPKILTATGGVTGGPPTSPVGDTLAAEASGNTTVGYDLLIK
jgi:hypothetical protein